jgi:CheY-like chemotaxis protein
MPREVLLVDDHDDFRELFADLVRRQGHTVTTRDNGKDALSYLMSAPPVGLVVLDLFMPDMDGFQFLAQRESNEALRRIPVVVLTAIAGPKPELDKFTIERVFEKPVSADLLLTLVRQYCRESSAPASPADGEP